MSLEKDTPLKTAESGTSIYTVHPHNLTGNITYSTTTQYHQEKKPKIITFITPKLTATSNKTLDYTSRVLPANVQSTLSTLLTDPLGLAKENLPTGVYNKIDQGVDLLGKGIGWTEDKVLGGFEKGKAILASLANRERMEEEGFGDCSSESRDGSSELKGDLFIDKKGSKVAVPLDVELE